MLTEARTSARKPKARAQSGPRLEHVGGRDADREQRADDDHRGDGVGHRHQRRVQRRRHRPDDVVADEDRQDEDGEAEDEGIDRPAGRRMGGGAGGDGELVGIDLRRVGGLPAPCRRRPGPFRGVARVYPASSCLTLARRARPASPGIKGRQVAAGAGLGGAGFVGTALGWKAGCTMAPSRVSSVALTSSSSQFGLQRLRRPCRSASRRRRRGSWRRAPRRRRRCGRAR